METKLWDQGPSCQQRGLPVAAKGSYDFCWLLRNGVFLGSSKQKKLGLVDQHVINTKKHLKTPMGMVFILTKQPQTSTPSKSMGNPRNPWNPRQRTRGRFFHIQADAKVSKAGCDVHPIYPKSRIHNSRKKLNLVEQKTAKVAMKYTDLSWMEGFFVLRFCWFFR